MFLYQPPTPDRKIKSIRTQAPGRKLEHASDFLSKGGLPVNPAVLADVRKRVLNGDFEDDREALITEIKADPGLYVYSARSLNALCDNVEKGVIPERELRQLDKGKLKKLFSVTEREISVHKTRNLTKAQALRLQHTVISSHTAQTIAEKTTIEPELAYSSALFRQLGLNLIAWNYPEQFARALAAQKGGSASLEEELEHMLGVTPEEITTKLTSEWNLYPDIQRSITFHEREGHEPVEHLSLGEICEFSELFAKANDTEYYPDAAQTWAIAEQNINQHLGGAVMTEAKQKVQEIIKIHSPTCAHPLKPGQILYEAEIEDELPRRGMQLWEKNLFVQRSTPETRDKFSRVYALIDDENFSVHALRMLVDSVVPSIGFTRGCVYLLDEEDLLLKPALRIGDSPLASYKPYKLYKNNLITTSFDTTVPIKQTGPGVTGERAEQICCGLGLPKHPGVLYLEINMNYFDSSQHDPLLYYHAVRQSLADCLNSGHAQAA